MENAMRYAKSPIIRLGQILAGWDWFSYDDTANNVELRRRTIPNLRRLADIFRETDYQDEEILFQLDSALSDINYRCIQAGIPQIGYSFTIERDGEPMTLPSPTYNDLYGEPLRNTEIETL